MSMGFHEVRERFDEGKKVLVIGIVVVMVLSWTLLRVQLTGFGKGEVTIGDGAQVQVDVAASDETRQRGLSGRTALGENEGMLFLFGEPVPQTFWMKDMNFPIDSLWIRDGEIVDIIVDTPPPKEGEDIPVFASREPVDAVLEVPSGFAARNGLRLGTPVRMRIDRYGRLR